MIDQAQLDAALAELTDQGTRHHWLADLLRELWDTIASMTAAERENQRTQLADADLLEEFERWVGCDLVEHLVEALVQARAKP